MLNNELLRLLTFSSLFQMFSILLINGQRSESQIGCTWNSLDLWCHRPPPKEHLVVFLLSNAIEASLVVQAALLQTPS